MRSIFGSKLLASALLLVGFVACSSENRGFGSSSPNLVDDSDAGTDSSAPQDCSGQRCSRDLHKIVDGCTEEVVQECSADAGCANGQCVSACDAAAAASGSIGCTFWTAAPDVLRDSDSGCFAAFIANTWSTPANVVAEFGNEPLDISQSVYRAIPGEGGTVSYELLANGIPPGEVGIVFLSQGEQTPVTTHHVDCPRGVNVAYHGVATGEHQTSLSKAFHLSTDVPVSAYSIFPYGGAKSYVPTATLLLPSTSWDTSYLLVDAWRYPHRVGLGYPIVQIVAQEDTEVRLRPNTDVVDGYGVTGGPAGSIVKWNLTRGQVLELSQMQSLAGSALEADKPVAIFGGNQCTNLPENAMPCDSLQQQIAPVHQWSTSYSAVPYKSRRKTINGAPNAAEDVLWQIMGANDGTTLTYDPAPPVGAPLALSAGERVFFTTDQIFSVKSQDAEHPIYLAVYMSSASVYATLGDPDYVNIVPNDQLLDHYVFFVDPTYRDSTLTVVRRKDVSGFHDVTLDCLGPVTDWKPLGTDGTTEYAWIDVTYGGLDVTTPVGKCTYGRHEASSDGPFGLYVWGTDKDASYGFPAGAGSRPTSPYTVIVR